MGFIKKVMFARIFQKVVQRMMGRKASHRHGVSHPEAHHPHVSHRMHTGNRNRVRP